MISRKSSRNLKDNFPNNKRKHNGSLTLYHETNTKSLEVFLVNKKAESFYSSEIEKLPQPSADPQHKYLKYTLNSMNAFIL